MQGRARAGLTLILPVNELVFAAIILAAVAAVIAIVVVVVVIVVFVLRSVSMLQPSAHG